MRTRTLGNELCRTLLRTTPPLALLVLLTIAPMLAWAQAGWQSDPMGPRLARGLSTQYGSFSAEDIDTINNFNGSVNLSIPIGPVYPAGGTLSYQLVAYYNSNDFDIRETLIQDGPPGSHPRPFSVRVPNALSNAGRGWSLHMGRLFERGEGAENEKLAQIDREKLPIVPAIDEIANPDTPGWLYVSPDGSTHGFKASLNGEVKTFTDVYYSRDGTYLRLKRLAPNQVGCPAPDGSGILACATIELPNGEVHFFEKKQNWEDWSFNRDKWRLRRIYDQTGVNGAESNTIRINYFADRWEIDDQYNNALRAPVKVYWQADHSGDPSKEWFYGRVERIELPKFGGGTPAKYSFTYAQIAFQRLADDGINFETKYAGYLAGITRPDNAGYTFLETTGSLDPIRTLRASLPTGGNIEWKFDSISLPFDVQCQGSNSSGPAQIYVSRRTVKDIDGNLLKETSYLRNVNFSSLVPANYCPSVEGLPATRTESELVTAEFQKYASGKGRLSLRYFSIFPLWGSNLGNGSAGGWTSLEYGRPFTRDESNSGLFLSTRTFDCPFDAVTPYQPNGLPTDIDVLAAGCVRLRSTYLAYEGGIVPPPCPYPSSEQCRLIHNAYINSLVAPMVRETTTIFHDDANKWISDKSSENDGFGHFRTLKLTGNFTARDTRESRVFYNAGNGELVVGADGATGTASSWVNKAPSERWYLGLYTHQKVIDVNGRVFRRQYCFDDDTGLLNQVRVRKNSDSDANAGIDHPNDILHAYEYSGGLPTKVKIYGGDTQSLALTGCAQSAFSALQPLYAIARVFEYGVLKNTRIVGASTTLADNTIDPSTGTVASSRDDRGINVDTFSFDAIGRLTSVVRNNNRADMFLTYWLPAYQTASSDDDYCERTITLPFPPQTITATGPRQDAVIKEGTEIFSHSKACSNDLGQVYEAYSRHPKSGEMKAASKFGPDGRLISQTVPQSVADFSQAAELTYTYDALGRVTRVGKPDGTVVITAYKGERESKVTVKIGTGESGTTVTQADSITTTSTDRFGNPAAVTTPGHTTALLFDGLNRAIRVGRGVQSRVYRFDGRGFLEWEFLPEFGNAASATGGGYVTYGKYDAIGNVLESFDGAISRYNSYDAQGRLTEINANATNNLAPLVRYIYGDATAGNGNGRITNAIRYNLANPVTTGMFTTVRSAIHEVEYGFVYTPTGQVDQRITSVRGWSDGVVANPLQEGVRFTQAWTYDAAGRVKAATYPSCLTASCTEVARGYLRTYASGGGLTNVSSSDAFAGVMGASFDYGPTGRLKAIHHNNGKTDWIGTDPSRLSRPGSYNLAGSATDANAPGLLNLGGFGYDAADNIVKIGNTKYLYDLNGRLIKAYNPSLASPGTTDYRLYAYDQYDNFTLKDSQLQSYDPSTNRHTDRAVIYDVAGRVVGAYTQYGFDYALDGRTQASIYNPTQVSAPCKPNDPGQTARCNVNLYGPDGERVGVISNKSGLGRNLAYQWYLRDLDGTVMRLYESTATSSSAVSAPVRIKDFLYAGSVLLATYSPVVSDAVKRTRHYHLDHLGTTRLATDAMGMPIAAARHYWPYGDDASTDLLGEWASEWAGYEEDANGLTHHLKARSYYKGWGRFLSPDPARAGWNLYAYANNNPIGFIDPSGLEPQCAERGVESNGAEAEELSRECAEEEEKKINEATKKCGDKCTETITVKEKAITVHLRSYAPFVSFGGGFSGDARGPTTDLNVSSKAAVAVAIDPTTGQFCSCSVTRAYSHYGRRGSDKSRFSASAVPNARVTQRDGKIFIDMTNSNPLVPGAADIDINAKLIIGNGTIDWYVSGDGFPNAELFIIDSQGRATMLDTFETNAGATTGPYTRLPGHGTVPMMLGSAAFPP